MATFAALSQTTKPSTTILGKNSPIVSKTTCQEYSIRVPKNCKKRYHVMRFNATNSVDFTKWKSQNLQIKMERENNLKEFKGVDEEIPKYGAGSEFGREAKEEARRKKYGIVTKKYKSEDQPWLLKVGGKTGKKYRGVREGGVSDNSSYYVFTQAGNGVIEAYPLQEWYNFQQIQKYKALTAEEAEEEFGRRHKLLNYFSLMSLKRARVEHDDVEDPDEIKTKKNSSKKSKKTKKDLKISDMDEYGGTTDEMSSSSSGDERRSKASGSDDGGKKKKDKKKTGGKKKKKKDSDDEAIEESDDGDEEGRELDYISDSSESASDHEMKANKELKGVAEEDALRKLLNSESDTEEEDESDKKKDENESNSDEAEVKEEKEEDGGDGNEGGGGGVGGGKRKKKLSKKKKKKLKQKSGKSDEAAAGAKKLTSNEDDESSSELSPNSTDTDNSDNNPKEKKKISSNKDSANSAGSSRSATPTPVVTGEKRKATNSELAVAAAKKVKLENGSTSLSSSFNLSEVGVTEDAVRRYLMRKPMTTTELLQKFKSKKTGLSSEQLVNVMTQILKNINPVKQTIKNKMYLSIKRC